MQIFTGIDIVENRRIENIKNLDRFLKKVFPEKLNYCFEKRKGELYGCIGARFALKEAFIKAFSKLNIEIYFSDIKIIDGGKNLKVEFSERLRKVLEKRNIKLSFDFSISHEKNYSVAIVIISVF